jgi:hypothetical protein
MKITAKDGSILGDRQLPNGVAPTNAIKVAAHACVAPQAIRPRILVVDSLKRQTHPTSLIRPAVVLNESREFYP